MANSPKHRIDDIFGSSPCLSLEELTAYVEDRLSAKQRFEIEKHITDCELCADAAEGLASAPNRGKVKEAVTSLNRDIKSEYTTQATKYDWRKYSVAAMAALTLIASFSYFLNRKPTPESLFEKYFTPYPNTTPLVRGEQPESSLQMAMAAYEKEDYEIAMQHLQDLLIDEPENTIVHFYLGNTKLALGVPDQAVLHFNRVLDEADTEFLEPADWYLGLAYLGLEDLEQARLSFNRIQSTGRSYKTLSEEIIRYLNELAK